MTPKQRKALGYTTIFGGLGLVAVAVLMRKPKSPTWLLHFKVMSEGETSSVLSTLENHGTVHNMHYTADDSLDVRWTPHNPDWSGVPEQHYATLLTSQEKAVA